MPSTDEDNYRRNEQLRATVDAVGSLPLDVAAELAGYLRSQLFAPLAENISSLTQECGAALEAQKDILQDAQAAISDVIEPAAHELLPLAAELEGVYAQIDLLETLIARAGESIRGMTAKVEKTEQAVRRETRALDDMKPLPMWKEFEPTPAKAVFRAGDYVGAGKLRDPRTVRERESPQAAVVASG